jgi:hypothetical protein
MKKAVKYRGNDTANSRGLCEICGDPIYFDTLDGQLIYVDLMCGRIHRHQPSPSSPAENRARIKASLARG